MALNEAPVAVEWSFHGDPVAELVAAAAIMPNAMAYAALSGWRSRQACPSALPT